MGNLNRNSPTYRGLEPRCRSRRVVPVSPGQGVATRFRPGAATAYGILAYYEEWAQNPGLALEVVSTLLPANKTSVRVFPAADISGTASWSRSTGAGTWFSHVDDDDNISDNISTTGIVPIMFRGNAASLAGKRILSVSMTAQTLFMPAGRQITLMLNLTGTNYEQLFVAQGASVTETFSGTWVMNPATGMPWTAGEVNTFITAAGGDEFGVRVGSGGSSIIVTGLWVTVSYCDENRVLWAYNGAPGEGPGWVQQQPSLFVAGVALSNNVWYYGLVWALKPGASVPLLSYPETLEAAVATDTTKEHRKAYVCDLDGAGVVLASTSVVGEYLPFGVSLSAIGVGLNAEAWPFVEVDEVAVYSGAPAAQLGQEITCTAAQTYGGVRLGLAWQSPTQRPDAPLLVKVRTTSFTGTVQVTATIDPDDAPAVGDWQQQFDGGATTIPGAAQAFVTIESAATAGRGWKVFALDVRDDNEFSNPLLASMLGESMNGTTDAASLASSTRDTSFDLSLALVQVTNYAGTLTATPVAAT